MPTVTFPGESGRKLLDNIKHHLALIDDAPTWRSMSAEERVTAEVRMVAFMVTAAWGYPWVSDPTYGSRLNRFLYLSSINRWIYNVTCYEDEHLIVDVRGDGIERSLNLGPAQGFSAVMPLTQEGYDAYMEKRLSPTQLTEPHIVPQAQSLHNTDYMMITGVVHFPSLVSERRLEGKTIPSAYPVIVDLLRQIGRFSPKLTIIGETVQVEGDASRPPPTILCFISGQGMGEPLLKKAGFVQEDEDKTGNRKYVLRLGSIHQPDDNDLLKTLLKTIIFYQSRM